MEIKAINKEQLDEFAGRQKLAQFLQSSVWGEFQQIMGASINRWGLEKGGNTLQAMQFFEKKLQFGWKYFYAPRISIKNLKNEELLFLFSKLKEEAGKKGVIFFRFDPTSRLSKIDSPWPVERTIDVQPSKTIILDLNQTEEEILHSMHQKTRYNIRLAERKGVVVKKAGIERFADFWKLMQATVARDGFRLHSAEHYRKMLCGEKLMSLYFAEFDQRAIAANIIAKFGDTAVYAHGASSNANRNLMAPYLLQWEIIKAARKEGYKYYDLYGVDQDKWPGVTRFKRGFLPVSGKGRGEEINYPGTYDLVFNPIKYGIYKSLRAIRRKIKF